MQRHGFDVLSLVLGVVFATVGAVFLVGDVDITRMRWDWAGPVALIVVGLLVLAGARSGRTGDREERADEPAGARVPDGDPDDGSDGVPDGEPGGRPGGNAGEAG